LLMWEVVGALEESSRLAILQQVLYTSGHNLSTKFTLSGQP